MNNYAKIIKPNINQLIHDNTNLVKKISWHLHGRVNYIVDIEDVIQIGMLGLISAAQNYVPKKNASFTSYASIRIKAIKGNPIIISGGRFKSGNANEWVKTINKKAKAVFLFGESSQTLKKLLLDGGFKRDLLTFNDLSETNIKLSPLIFFTVGFSLVFILFVIIYSFSYLSSIFFKKNATAI